MSTNSGFDLSQRPIDLDPAPFRIRTNAGASLELVPSPPPKRSTAKALDVHTMTPGQKRRFCRNLGIVAGHSAGISQRELARIFDLPRSRIAAILQEYRGLAAGQHDDEGRTARHPHG